MYLAEVPAEGEIVPAAVVESLDGKAVGFVAGEAGLNVVERADTACKIQTGRTPIGGLLIISLRTAKMFQAMPVSQEYFTSSLRWPAPG